MMDFGGIYLNNHVLEIYMYDFVDRDHLTLDDNFIEPIHESWLQMQDANKTKALSRMLTVKWPFSNVESVNIIAPLLCSTSWTL